MHFLGLFWAPLHPTTATGLWWPLAGMAPIGGAQFQPIECQGGFAPWHPTCALMAPWPTPAQWWAAVWAQWPTLGAFWAAKAHCTAWVGSRASLVPIVQLGGPQMGCQTLNVTKMAQKARCSVRTLIKLNYHHHNLLVKNSTTTPYSRGLPLCVFPNIKVDLQLSL